MRWFWNRHARLRPGISLSTSHPPGWYQSFSEKVSVLNARLEELLPAGTAEDCKIQGYNGHSRRVPLNPLFAHWTRPDDDAPPGLDGVKSPSPHVP